MSDERHPPIPPNTKHFVKNDLQGEIFYLPWPKTPASRLDKPINDIHVRKIIAAVAIEEWELTVRGIDKPLPEWLQREDFLKYIGWNHHLTDIQSRGRQRMAWAAFVDFIQEGWRLWGGWRDK